MDYGKSSKNVFLPSSVLKAFIKVSLYKRTIYMDTPKKKSKFLPKALTVS